MRINEPIVVGKTISALLYAWRLQRKCILLEPFLYHPLSEEFENIDFSEFNVENGEEFTVGSLSPPDECDNQCTCLDDGTWGNCTTNPCEEDLCADVVCEGKAAYCMSETVAQPYTYAECQPATGPCMYIYDSGNEPVFCDSIWEGWTCQDGACVPPTE